MILAVACPQAVVAQPRERSVPHNRENPRPAGFSAKTRASAPGLQIRFLTHIFPRHWTPPIKVIEVGPGKSGGLSLSTHSRASFLAGTGYSAIDTPCPKAADPAKIALVSVSVLLSFYPDSPEVRFIPDLFYKTFTFRGGCYQLGLIHEDQCGAAGPETSGRAAEGRKPAA